MEGRRPLKKMEMAKDVIRTLFSVRRWRTVARLALAFLLCFFTLAWGKSNGHPRRTVKLQRGVYGQEIISLGVRPFETEYKKRIVIARRQGRGRSSRNGDLTERGWRGDKGLSPEEKAGMDRKFREWRSLPPEKQELLRRRMKRWNELPPEDRSLYKQRFQQWQRLSPEEQERIRERLKKWKALPQEEKEEIRRRFRR
jgi:hypothetical protein